MQLAWPAFGSSYGDRSESGILSNHRYLAISLDDGEFDLLKGFNALARTRSLHDICFDQSRMAQAEGRQRLLIGWFGIRGIGSFYYLFYALNHDLGPAAATLCTDLTLSVVTLSILVHGISTQPMLARYERRNQQDV